MISREYFEKIFAAFRKANRSHWKIPDWNIVESEIKNNGIFDFYTGPKENWVSKLMLNADHGEMIINPTLTPNMQKGAEQIKQIFLELMNTPK